MAEVGERNVITTEQTIKFLAMDENELRILATREHLAAPFIEFIGLIVLKKKISEIGIEAWNLYSKGKKFGQQMSGDYLAELLAANGGVNFCEETNYCEFKSKLQALFDFSDTPEGKALFAAGITAVIEEANEYAETIDQLTEFINLAVEVVTGSIPGSFVFLSIKHGLDKLCNCCEHCDGTGTINGQSCDNCNGNGFLPYLR